MTRRRTPPIHQMNVVPYIDVMLVLLVIFMVAAPLVQPATIDLPKSNSATTDKEIPKKRIRVEMVSPNRYIISDDTNKIAEVGHNALTQKIKSIQAQMNVTAADPLYINFAASPQTIYGDVIERVDFMRAIADTRITLLVQKKTH